MNQELSKRKKDPLSLCSLNALFFSYEVKKSANAHLEVNDMKLQENLKISCYWVPRHVEN